MGASEKYPARMILPPREKVHTRPMREAMRKEEKDETDETGGVSFIVI